MSTFVDHLVEELAAKAIPSTNHLAQLGTSVNDTRQKQVLRSLLMSLKFHAPISAESLLKCFNLMWEDIFSTPSKSEDREEEFLKKAVVGRMIVAVYAAALRTYLAEAAEAETESEWWDTVERSRGNLALYFLQTLPSRLRRLSRTIIHTFEERKASSNFSTHKSTIFSQLFPSNNIFHYNALTTSLFPHLRNQPQVLSFSLFPSSQFSFPARSLPWLATLRRYSYIFVSAIMLPINLARQECRSKRHELERLRDQRAQILGMLTDMRGSLANLLTEQSAAQDAYFNPDPYLHVVKELRNKLGDLSIDESTDSDLFDVLYTIICIVLPPSRRDHKTFLKVNRLLRPSRLTLVWPNLILSPLLVFYTCKSVYASRASLLDMVKGACDTIRGFWKGWLLDPLKDVLRTVRTGGEDSVIVQREALAADFSSLERMVLSLAKDELHYSADQLTSLSSQVRQGDLTAVLELYEEEIKSPVKSALTGPLLRSLFVQVQKAKVDINQALSGIDKLLKSQELTFAFVGVAPALSLVYITAGYIRGLWSGWEPRGLYGGERRRTAAWLAMRRIERLLIRQPHNFKTANLDSSSNIPPLTTGLILLSVTRLRHFTEKCLPPSSRIREGLLEDIQDLEDPGLGRLEKMRTVDRMWRCWGASLRWDRGMR